MIESGLDGEWRLGARGVLAAGYALTDSRVREFAPDRTLEGLRLIWEKNRK